MTLDDYKIKIKLYCIMTRIFFISVFHHFINSLWI